ncbi:MAG: hypothetical protein WCH11_01420 [Bdellovibrio sp.]
MSFMRKNRINLKSYLKLFACLFLFSFIYLFSSERSLDIPTFHIDGAYQTASVMYRLSAGHLPGRDFFPYLGIAVNLLLFPVYFFAGENVASSQLSANVMTFLGGVTSIGLVHYLISAKKKILDSVFIGLMGQTFCLFFKQIHDCNVITFGPYSIGAFFSDLFLFPTTPGVSLRPLRSLVPYLLTICLAPVIRGQFEKKQHIVTSFAIALSLLWSNDFAIPSFSLFILLLMCLFFFWRLIRLKNIFYNLFFGISLWFLFLSVITGGHVLDLLSYNFLDVAKDQWWYFGPYDSHLRIFGFGDILKLVGFKIGLQLFLTISFLIHSVRSRNLSLFFLGWIGLTLFAGGFLASVGGHVGGYHQAFSFWFSWTVFFLIGSTVGKLFQKKLVVENLSTARLLRFRSIFLTFLSFLILILQADRLVVAKSLRSKSQEKMFVEELGGYLPSTFDSYVDLARAQKGKPVFEEYWGIFSAITKSFSPWPVDSVIHALGKVRDVGQRFLSRVDLVITTRFQLSMGWQPWNLTQNFWFYDNLFKEWDIYFVSPTTIVWSRINRPRESVSAQCKVMSDDNRILIHTPGEGYYRVEVRYNLRPSFRRLVLSQTNIPSATDRKGFVSLNPRGHSATYPVYVDSAGSHEFVNQVLNGSNHDLSVETCSASAIGFFSKEVFRPPNHVIEEFYFDYNGDAKLISARNVPREFYLSDANWIKGIGRHHSGYILPNIEFFRKIYLDLGSNNMVIFENGQSRKITSVVENGDYLSIYVDGPTLISNEVGYPHNFRVQK